MVTKVQRYLYVVLFAVFFLFIVSAVAYGESIPMSSPTRFDSGHDIFLEDFEKVDHFVIGSTVLINDTVPENLLVIGKTIDIEGRVRENLVVTGKSINIRGDIKYNLLAKGVDIQVIEDIGEDAYIVGDRVLIQGDIDDDLYVMARSVYIDESVKIKGDLVIKSPSVKIHDRVVVLGDVSINGQDTLDNFRSAEIPVDLRFAPKNNPIAMSGYEFLFILLVIVGESLLGVVLFKYVGNKMRGIIGNMDLTKDMVTKNLIIGVKSLVFVIIAFIVLLVSVLGWPILVAGLMAFSLMSYFAELSYAYKLGDLLIGAKVKKECAFGKTFTGYLTITLVFGLVTLIPVVGVPLVIVASLLLSVWSLGAAVRTFAACSKQCNS